jgi:cytochrome b6-f complex iron-sulfur subunit
MNRRFLLGYIGLGFLSGCFPVVLAACAPQKSEADNKGSVKDAEGFTAIGSVADLDKTGQLKTKQVVVLRDAKNPKQLYAVNPTCTHKGCTVDWQSGEKKFECPCHDSDFAADGKLLKGPATKPLASYPVKIVGDRVLVKV